MDGLEEVERFLEMFNLSRLNQEEIEIMNNPITSTETEAVIKTSQKTKAQDQMASQKNSVKHLEKSQRLSSVTQLCPTLCDHMDCSMPGLPVHHQLQEFTQSHVN